MGITAPLHLHPRRVGIPHGVIFLIRWIKNLKIAGGQGVLPSGRERELPSYMLRGMASNGKMRISPGPKKLLTLFYVRLTTNGLIISGNVEFDVQDCPE